MSWSCVRLVKQICALEPTEETITCPICLDAFTCARITKCGHAFCLPCLLHHAHAFAANHPYAESGPRCPCCSIPLHLEDVRPVVFVHSPAPAVDRRIRLVKLHRVKGCAAPFVPQPDRPRRAAPYAAPTQSDDDAAFTRFNYVDPVRYQTHLVANLQELEQMEIYGDVDAMCRGMALQAVQKQLQEAMAEADQELEYMERFAQSTAGVSQSQPPYLQAERHLATESSTAEHVAEASESWERTRSASMGSESHHHHDEEQDEAIIRRCRSESMGPEHSSHRRRARGDSLVSHDSSTQSDRNQHRMKTPSSMYSGPEESVFYQAEDGRLCFLCGFDMSCLRSDYADALPESEVFQQATTAAQRRKLLPLPDFVEGRILELEHVHLTPEKRQRLRFLSHLPLYTDICFVELSLGHLLSKQTKKAFAKDFQKRKNARTKKAQLEQREDARVQRQEEARINERKARMQRIDPHDEFFQPIIPEPEPTFDGEDFGPSIAGDGAPRSPVSSSPSNPNDAVGISFSQIARQGGALPSLAADDEAAFPALGSSSPTTTTTGGRGPPPPAPWGPVTKSTESPAGPNALTGKKKKGGGKKVVLFSTGGQRDSG